MRVGIVGSGGIVNQCLDSISSIQGIEATAIWGREVDKPQVEELSAKYSINKSYTDYQEFLGADDVDIVYIGIINNLHYSYALEALKKGKSVICEKPFTITAEEARELRDVARENNLFLFEAITLLHSPNYKHIKENLDKIGETKLIQCNFSQYSSRYDKYKNGEVLPVFNPELSGGCLYDLNVYNIHFVVGLFGMPQETKYYPNKGFNGIDTSGIAILKYPDFVATCSSAKDSTSDNFAVIQGDEGSLSINGATNFCSSGRTIIGGEVKDFNFNEHESHMTNEFMAFRDIFKSEDYTRCYELLDHTVAVIEVIDSMRKENKLF